MQSLIKQDNEPATIVSRDVFHEIISETQDIHPTKKTRADELLVKLVATSRNSMINSGLERKRKGNR
jgi:hypothetical protein